MSVITVGIVMTTAGTKGWYKGRDKAWERGYRAGWNDRDDHRGGWGRGPGGRGHGHGHGHH